MFSIQKSPVVLLYLFIILFKSVPATAQIELALPDTAGVIGETKVIAVSLGDVTNRNVTSYQFRIYYDPGIIAFREYDTGGTLTQQAGGMFAVNLKPDAGNYIIVAYAGTNSLTGAGALMFFEVDLLEAGTSSLELAEVGFWNIQAEKLEVNTIDGSIEVNIVSNTRDPHSNNTREIPGDHKLKRNYPNPFNPLTTIQYALPESGHVQLTIYDRLGQLVKTLVNEEQGAGYYTIHWDATNEFGKTVSSGMYIYRLRLKNFIGQRQMIFLK